MSQIFLITGATGRQGGAVASELLRGGHEVRAMTRQPASLRGDALRRQGMTVVRGDFNDESTLQAAAGGVDGVFIMSTPEHGPGAEMRQGIAAIDAAVEAGVRHIVYSSLAGANEFEHVAKHRIEQHLTTVDVPSTVLAATFFRDNLLSTMVLVGLREGRLDLAIPGYRGVQNVELAEYACLAADVLEAPEAHLPARVTAASDELTPKQMASIMQDVIEMPVRHNDSPPSGAQEFQWLAAAGDADIPELRARHPGIRWRSFEEWAVEQDWSTVQAITAR